MELPQRIKIIFNQFNFSDSLSSISFFIILIDDLKIHFFKLSLS